MMNSGASEEADVFYSGGRRHFQSYLQAKQPQELFAAVDALTRAVEHTPPDAVDRWERRLYLGQSLLVRYRDMTSAKQDLDAAIAALEGALREGPARRELAQMLADGTAFVESIHGPIMPLPAWIEPLIHLGEALYRRYRHMGEERNLEDLEQAIRALGIATSLLQAGNDPRWLTVHDIQDRARRAGGRTYYLTWLNGDIALYSKLVAAVNPGSHEWKEYVYGFTQILQEHYSLVHQPVELDKAIAIYRQLMTHVPVGTQRWLQTIDNLVDDLGRRYRATGKAEDLDEMIAVLRSSVAQSPDTSPNWYKHVCQLIDALHVRYQNKEQSSDLNEIIFLLRQAVVHSPVDGIRLGSVCKPVQRC